MFAVAGDQLPDRHPAALLDRGGEGIPAECAEGGVGRPAHVGSFLRGKGASGARTDRVGGAGQERCPLEFVARGGNTRQPFEGEG